MASKKLSKCLDGNSSLPTDVKFVFKQDDDVTEVKAHKMILAIASDVFEREFFGSLKSEDEIVIPDVNKEVFQTMINYIYNKQIVLKIHSPTFMASLYYLAEKYIIEDLRDEILAAIEELEISRKSVFEIALLAEESILHLPLSNALYDAVATFLQLEFEDNMLKTVEFFTEPETTERRSLVIVKVLKLLVLKQKTSDTKLSICGNCQKSPCFNGGSVVDENFVVGASVTVMFTVSELGCYKKPVVSNVTKLGQKAGPGCAIGLDVNGKNQGLINLNRDWYVFNCI